MILALSVSILKFLIINFISAAQAKQLASKASAPSFGLNSQSPSANAGSEEKQGCCASKPNNSLFSL